MRPALHASPMFLREEEVRRGLDLLTLGAAQLARLADPILAAEGLARGHHRALTLIVRRPGMTVGTLLRLLGVTKQSLGRVTSELAARALIELRGNAEDRRQRLWWPTEAGRALEARVFAALAERVRDAYGRAGQQAVSGFWQVLDGLIQVEDRALVDELAR